MTSTLLQAIALASASISTPQDRLPQNLEAAITAIADADGATVTRRHGRTILTSEDTTLTVRNGQIAEIASTSDDGEMRISRHGSITRLEGHTDEMSLRMERCDNGNVRSVDMQVDGMVIKGRGNCEQGMKRVSFNFRDATDDNDLKEICRDASQDRLRTQTDDVSAEIDCRKQTATLRFANGNGMSGMRF